MMIDMNNEEDRWGATFEVADAIELMILNVASVLDQMTIPIQGIDKESMNWIKAKGIKSLLDVTTEEDIFQILSKYDFKFPDSGN